MSKLAKFFKSTRGINVSTPRFNPTSALKIHHPVKFIQQIPKVPQGALKDDVKNVEVQPKVQPKVQQVPVSRKNTHTQPLKKQPLNEQAVQLTIDFPKEEPLLPQLPTVTFKPSQVTVDDVKNPYRYASTQEYIDRKMDLNSDD